MSKVILVLYLLAAVTFVASIDTEKFDSGNMTAIGTTRGWHIKGGICWNTMRKECCKGCKGDGCIPLMCWACC
uniref:Uncharacterized protein n=1 Tax=Acrobeloides nanus TaxID=290746 RepID=A0A914BW25_9BILA